MLLSYRAPRVVVSDRLEGCVHSSAYFYTLAVSVSQTSQPLSLTHPSLPITQSLPDFVFSKLYLYANNHTALG